RRRPKAKRVEADIVPGERAAKCVNSLRVVATSPSATRPGGSRRAPIVHEAADHIVLVGSVVEARHPQGGRWYRVGKWHGRDEQQAEADDQEEYSPAAYHAANFRGRAACLVEKQPAPSIGVEEAVN